MSSQTVLEILIQAVDETSSVLAGTQENLKQVSEAAQQAGVQLTIAGAAITAAYVGVVDSAANVQESQDSLKQAVTDAMASASGSTASYATQVAFLQAKIDGYKASIAEATATLDTNTGSAEKSSAAHAKAAADIAADQTNLQKYTEQLDILTNSQDLNGESATAIVSTLEDQADANVDLGFSVAESTHSLSQAFTATKNVSEALQVNQAAMDLARAKNLDLATATNQVILAMNGQGRALATYGIQIKDGLSGMQALEAVQSAVNGQAQAYAGTLSGSLAVAMQSFNKLLSDIGSTQLPLLTQLLQIIVKIIDAVDDWTQKHQRLTEDILIFIGVLGVTLTVLGTLLVVVGTVGLALTAGLSAAFIGVAAAVAVGIAAIVAIGIAIVQNWDYIRDNFVAVWQILESGWTTFWTFVKNAANLALEFLANLFGLDLALIEGNWTIVWTAVSTFFTGIWDGIKTAATEALSFLTNQLNTFVSWAKGILGDIVNPIQGVGNLISGTENLAKGAASAVTSVVNVHDAVITPGGQVIHTDPSDYLFATKTPGSMGGGGVTINLNGGMFLNDQAVTLLANTIAKQINRQVRTRNYAT